MQNLKIEDYCEIFQLLDTGREYLRIWLPFVDKTKEENDTKEFIALALDKPYSEKEMISAIYYEDNTAGLISIKNIDRDNKKVEIGYWLGLEYHGKGIITECCKALLEYIFEKKVMNRVCIKVAEFNYKSRRIPEKLGFKFEGVERQGELYKVNNFYNLYVYSMLKTEYYEQKKRWKDVDNKLLENEKNPETLFRG